MKNRDRISLEMRSAVMRAVKSRNGKSTEWLLRAALVAKGVRGCSARANNTATLHATDSKMMPGRKWAT